MIFKCYECLTEVNENEGKIVLEGDKANPNTIYETCFYCNSCIEMFDTGDITILKWEIDN